MLRSLPWFIRLPLALPVLGFMLYIQYMAISSQRDFERWRDQEPEASYELGEMSAEPVPVGHNTSPVASHYIGAEEQEPEGPSLSEGVWMLLAAGCAGVSVLAGGLALFSFFGSREPEEGATPARP